MFGGFLAGRGQPGAPFGFELGDILPVERRAQCLYPAVGLRVQIRNGFVGPGTRPGGGERGLGYLSTESFVIALPEPRLGFPVLESPALSRERVNPSEFLVEGGGFVLGGIQLENLGQVAGLADGVVFSGD